MVEHVGRLVLLVLSFVVACGPPRPAKTPLVPHAVTVYVAVSDAAAKTDSGNVAAMVDAIEAKLTKEGYLVTIVAARSDERPPVPRLELQVLSSDSGSATARGAGDLTGFFGTAGLVGGLPGPHRVSGAARADRRVDRRRSRRR
jgi:hypothetical protein